MQKHVNKVLAIVVGLIFYGCHSTELEKVPAAANGANPPHCSKSAPKTYFLIVAKAKVADPLFRQRIGEAAVRKISDAARKSYPEIIVDALAENVMTKEQYERGEMTEKVTGDIFKKRLERLANTTTPQDTVIIYTHSHGQKNGFEESQPLGGIAIDLPVRQPEHRGVLLWDKYVELLLKIPAKNVVVLTMSCFSGGLIEYLDSPEVKALWRDRRQVQGRNLVILTGQSKDLTTGPIMKDGELVNPFLYAVAMAFAGEADGFCMVNGKPAAPGSRDSQLTVGEMIDYILYTTKNTTSDDPERKNDTNPQLTGSFDREDVLIYSTKEHGVDTQDRNTVQQEDSNRPR